MRYFKVFCISTAGQARGPVRGMEGPARNIESHRIRWRQGTEAPFVPLPVLWGRRCSRAPPSNHNLYEQIICTFAIQKSHGGCTERKASPEAPDPDSACRRKRGHGQKNYKNKKDLILK